MNKYIEEAKKYLRVAVNELNEAKENGKTEVAVDGCEKGWLALNLALQAMFVEKGIKPKELPKSYRGMRYFLRKYGDKELRKLFESARSVLHIDGFWDRDVAFEEVEEIMDDIRECISVVEKNFLYKNALN